MLMCYGLFVFGVLTAPFDQASRATAWRWAVNNRTGNEPAYQFVGRGEDQITLTGILMPEYSGGPISLTMLREMAERGEPYLLMRGTGEVLGYWLIESLNETRSELLPDGQAMKIEFQLVLKRYDGLHNPFGKLAPLIPLITRLF